MKKYLTVVSFLLISVLSSLAVIAQADVDPEVILSSTEIRMFNDDEQSLDVTIKNTETKSDTFTISVFPPEFKGLTVTPEVNHVNLGPGETRTVKLTFRSPVEVKICEPQVETCPVAYTITILSTSDDSITTTKDIQAQIKNFLN